VRYDNFRYQDFDVRSDSRFPKNLAIIQYYPITSLNCKRELLELWWGLEIESHTENISGN
jgi:hypothetical protein